MARFLGLDMGEKNIGVAVSDPLGRIAQGLEVIQKNGSDGLDRIGELVRAYQVEKIVIGLPKNMNGSIGNRGRDVLAFAEQVAAEFRLPVETHDERLSTVEAERVLVSSDVSRKKRKKVVDKMAAAIILQGYLDAHQKD